MKIQIKIKKETKNYVYFYLYIEGSQTCMTLQHKDFAELCGLLSKGQIGLPLDKIVLEGCMLEWADETIS